MQQLFEDDEYDECEQKGTEGRRPLTDRFTLLLFVLWGLGALVVAFWGVSNGNLGRLYKGVNYNGKICGIDSGVEALPFLYWFEPTFFVSVSYPHPSLPR